jgi:hypothetical protein
VQFELPKREPVRDLVVKVNKNLKGVDQLQKQPSVKSTQLPSDNALLSKPLRNVAQLE